jgi:ectoine hydroxylase-related dioxygenase (phytanoyl-CoA dioxygenase family)
MNQHLPTSITEAQIDTYERDGAVRVPAVLDREWIGFLASALDAARTRPGPNAQDHTVDGEPGGYLSDLHMTKRVPDFLTFARDSPVGELASVLMPSERVNLLHDAMWIKEPGTSRRTPWHHDQPFYCMKGSKMCVVWIPLDDHSHEISLGLLRGSHRWGHRYRPERINGGWYEGYGEDDGFVSPPDVANHPEQYDILSWDMHVGDCIVFHGLTLHGAPGNPTQHVRRAISLVLVGDDAVYVEREQETQPSYAGNGLKPGDPIDNDYFPRLYPS